MFHNKKSFILFFCNIIMCGEIVGLCIPTLTYLMSMVRSNLVFFVRQLLYLYNDYKDNLNLNVSYSVGKTNTYI